MSKPAINTSLVVVNVRRAAGKVNQTYSLTYTGDKRVDTERWSTFRQMIRDTDAQERTESMVIDVEFYTTVTPYHIHYTCARHELIKDVNLYLAGLAAAGLY